MKLTPVLLLICSLLLPIGSQSIRAENPALPDGKLAIVKDEFSLMNNERIGNLRIGLSEAKVKQAINCQLKREPEQFWAADAAYHQTWKYANCGITLDMVSDKAGAPKSIASISLTKPSRLSTTRGIRIGSTANAAMKAYKSE